MERKMISVSKKNWFKLSKLKVFPERASFDDVIEYLLCDR
jgi:predicted CopG family antitoxin